MHKRTAQRWPRAHATPRCHWLLTRQRVIRPQPLLAAHVHECDASAGMVAEGCACTFKPRFARILLVSSTDMAISPPSFDTFGFSPFSGGGGGGTLSAGGGGGGGGGGGCFSSRSRSLRLQVQLA